ncbi:MAG: glutamine-hydrolyzing GMP synthase, partial [Alphaproteobacteria bacterium]
MATSSPISEKILIIDFGSQVTQLIARRIREAGVYSEVHPCFRIDKAFLDVYQPKAIVLSGGPASVMAEGAPTIDPLVFELGIPVLGICYGQQLMCHLLGGKVEDSDHQEFGRASLDIGVDDCALFDGVWSPGDQPQVWMSHGDRVTALPEGFRVVATSSGAPFAATTDAARGFYGVQFHPEVVHTIDGSKLLFNFVRNIAGCNGTWTMAAYKTAAIEKIRAQVGDSRVICGLSGGVDSSVAAVLIHEAIGDQLTCIFVDHGLLRMNEGAEVDKVFRERFNIPLVTRNAADMFLDQLEGVDDPEQKRKIIGSTFIDVFDEEAAKLGGADFLAQGTLYPDVIESVSP